MLITELRTFLSRTPPQGPGPRVIFKLGDLEGNMLFTPSLLDLVLLLIVNSESNGKTEQGKSKGGRLVAFIVYKE